MIRRVLIVSEDMELIADAQERFRHGSVRVLGCAGPVHGPCAIASTGSCPLAARSDLTLVVSPVEGSFGYQSLAMAAGDYAELLQRRHPETHVILCGGPEGSSGATGEVTSMSSAGQALHWVAAFGSGAAE